MIGNLMYQQTRPTHSLRRFVWCVIVLPCAFLCILGWATGIRINTSDSLPHGLYITAAQGPLVKVCLSGDAGQLADMRGYRSWAFTCPGRREALLKAIAGIPGDTVSVSEQGVSINGKLWPDSRPLSNDSAGRPLPVVYGKFTVHQGMIWVMGLNPRSFDSRYYGQIPGTWIADRMRQLWLWR